MQKRRIFTSKLLGYIKTFKHKMFWKFCFFLYNVLGAWCGGNFSPTGEYSSTVKNRQKWASVHRRVGVKGLFSNIYSLEGKKTNPARPRARGSLRRMINLAVGTSDIFWSLESIWARCCCRSASSPRPGPASQHFTLAHPIQSCKTINIVKYSVKSCDGGIHFTLLYNRPSVHDLVFEAGYAESKGF